MNLHIYIILNPVGIKNAERKIVQFDLLNQNTKRVLFNLNNFPVNHELWDEVIYLDNNALSRSKLFVIKLYNAIIKGITYRKYFKLFKNYSKLDFSSVEVYYQNLQCPLSNAIFFGSEKLLKNKNISFNVIEEGIGNYYEYFQSFPQERKKFKSRILFFFFFGLKLHLPISQIGCNYPHVKKVYVQMPKLAISPTKSIEIKFPKIELKEFNKSILILGQESNVLTHGINYYINSQIDLINSIADQFPNYKIIYKPHWDFDFGFYNNLPIILKNKTELFKSEYSIEDVIESIKPEVICSFTSSALVNLRLLFNDQTNSFVKIFYRNSFNSPSEIENIFEKLSIKKI